MTCPTIKRELASFIFQQYNHVLNKCTYTIIKVYFITVLTLLNRNTLCLDIRHQFVLTF